MIFQNTMCHYEENHLQSTLKQNRTVPLHPMLAMCALQADGNWGALKTQRDPGGRHGCWAVSRDPSFFFFFFPFSCWEKP